MRWCLQILQKEDYPRLPTRLHPIIWGLKRKRKKVGLEIKDTGRRGETEAIWDPKESVCSVSSEMFRDGRTPDCSRQGSTDPHPTQAVACLPPRWSWKQIILWSLQKGQQPSQGLDFSLVRLKQWDQLSPLDFCSMELHIHTFITLCYSSKGQINILAYISYMCVIHRQSVELDTKGLLDPKHY